MSSKEKREFKVVKKVIEKEFNVETGSRFKKGTAKQLAFEVIVAGVKEGKNYGEIKQDLIKIRKENGYRYDLDSAYLNYVVSSHPEYFEVYVDGTIKLIKEPVIDVNAIADNKRRNVNEMRKVARKVRKMRRKNNKK